MATTSVTGVGGEDVVILSTDPSSSLTLDNDFATVGLSQENQPELTFDDAIANFTHALRLGPNTLTQEPRTLARKELSEAQKVSKAFQRQKEKMKREKMVTDLDELTTKHRDELAALANAHSVHVDYLTKLQGTLRTKLTRDVNLENAKLHAKAKEVNSGLPIGERLKMSQIRELVAADPELQDLTKEQEAELKQKVLDERQRKKLGARVTNKSAAQDYRACLSTLNDMATSLNARTGAAVIIIASRAHLEDTFEPNFSCTSNAVYFARECLKMGMWDLTRMLEQWACSKTNARSPDSLNEMRKEVSAIINGNLSMYPLVLVLHRLREDAETVAQNRQVIMNYTNYDMQVIQKYSVKMVGWTFDKFVSPYDIHTIDDVRTLLDALHSGACHWVRLTKAELSNHAKEIAAREAAGETVGKKRKTRSDAGMKKGPQAKPKMTTSSASSPLKKKVRVKKLKSARVARQLPPKAVRSKSVISDSDVDDISATNSDDDIAPPPPKKRKAFNIEGAASHERDLEAETTYRDNIPVSDSDDNDNV